MSAATIIVIVIVLVILAVAAAAASFRIRRASVERDQFGPEYQRLAREIGPRKANAEFARRRQRVDGLGITALSDEKRVAYARRWDAAQERFIDSPAQAVNMADTLITAVAAERGYQAADDLFLEDLSVYHGRHLDGYRNARLTNGRASQGVTTEGRRRALLAYRALFFDLLAAPGDGVARGTGPRRGRDRAAADLTDADDAAAERRAESEDVAATR